jgi:photosystem II stability/assembly factor-like uncharacterized protein
LRSADSGQSWQASVAGLLSGALKSTSYLAVEPASPYRLFIANGGGIYGSTNRGASWQNANPPTNNPFNSIAFAPGESPVLYAASTSGLFRTFDGAQTWQRAQGNLGQLEIWSLAAADVSDRQVVYAATIGGLAGGAPRSLGRATNGESLTGAGVYRGAARALDRCVYLPVVMRK